MKNVLSKVVMLPTEKATKLLTDGHRIVAPLTEGVAHAYTNNGFKYQHLYFTIDEEVIIGNYYYDSHNGLILQANDFSDHKRYLYKKVVASTDESLGLPRPSNEFLFAYCKLGGINEVLIQYYEIWSDLERNETEDSFKYKIKVASDNTITIHHVKQVKEFWSREEVEDLCRKAFTAGCDKQEAYAIFSKRIVEDISSEEEQLVNEQFDSVLGQNNWIKENIK